MCPPIDTTQARRTADAGTAGSTPQLGDRFLRPICVKTWPRELGMTIPAALQGLPFPYRFTVRWVALDKLEAKVLLNSYQKKWELQVKPLWTLILEAITRHQSTKVNQEAVEHAASLQRARAAWTWMMCRLAS